MFLERPEGISDNNWLAQRVVDVKEALNGASNAMKVTPFLSAGTREELMMSLDLFAQDIGEGADRLRSLVRSPNLVEFDEKASGAHLISEILLADPSENRVWKEFDRARGAVTFTLDDMKTAARETAMLSEGLAQQAMKHINVLYNVVKGVETFYRRVPAEASAQFIFK